MSEGNRPHIPILAIVGGFLGAGKTTLILKAAQLLAIRGKRVAAIFNDQDAGLVDTAHALAQELDSREVAGGCFCCRFSDFARTAVALSSQKPGVIFAEPVGSCIDLAATVIRPLQNMYADALRLAPLTVLIDPTHQPPDRDSHYLMTKQLAEADLVCTTRADLYAEDNPLAIPIDFRVSGTTGSGVDAWLDEILNPSRIFGARLLEVDYKRYADAEEALGWLNLQATVELETPRSPASLCGPLLDHLADTLQAEKIAIAHLKVFDRTAGGWVKASLCGNGSDPVPEGNLMADPSSRHELALNLRALADPSQLEELVRASLARIDGAVLTIRHLGAFRPAAPQPEYRMS